MVVVEDQGLIPVIAIFMEYLFFNLLKSRKQVGNYPIFNYYLQL